jgi:hypothetical protein
VIEGLAEHVDALHATLELLPQVASLLWGQAVDLLKNVIGLTHDLKLRKNRLGGRFLHSVRSNADRQRSALGLG